MNSGISKVARGAGIIFLGAFVLYIFRFCYKLLVSRYLGPEDFGLFSLGLMIVNISSLLATVGLNNGIVKFIAHYNGLGDKERVKGTPAEIIVESWRVKITRSPLFTLGLRKDISSVLPESCVIEIGR